MIAIQDLERGTKIRLKGEIVAEVSENPRDGVWMYVRYIEAAADPQAAGREEIVHADDVLEVL